tara:strand:- start:933 stop:1934 length:1002 start_codon:yes stop_codon:yes gene_type:complete
VCQPFELGPYVTISQETLAQEGAAIAARVLTARKDYGHLELGSGRKARLVPGDIIIGVLGSRAALRGFCGRPPSELRPGDRLQLLNQGGVIGLAEGSHAGLGAPIDVEVLGTPVRQGKPLLLSDYGLEVRSELPAALPPVLLIVGTCMHAGKTTAAAVITRYLRGMGRVVHAGKVTGVASIGDLLMFADNGAEQTLSFLDCGIASTCYRDDIPQVARTLLSHLAEEKPDLIVLEMGDGLLGEYGVDSVLADETLRDAITGVVLAANDTVGAIAAAEQLQQAGLKVRVVVGPATDSSVGPKALGRLGLDSANVLLEAKRVCVLATAGMLEGPSS